MRISILTGCFYPQIHPRAFRATELADEFKRMGHEVSVINLRIIEGFDYKVFEKEHGYEVHNYNVYKGDGVVRLAANASSQSLLGRIKRFAIDYFLCGHLFKYGFEIKNLLKGYNDDETDMFISISTPFPDLYGFAKYAKTINKHYVTIADSGDPFYYSKQTKRAIWFKYIEKIVYKQFDFLTIPTENAINSYSPLIDKSKIRIIPQGFNMRNIKLYDGNFSKIPCFAYSGVFYWDIRNPEFLFSALNDISQDFVFYVFMRYDDAHLHNVLLKYPNLLKKIRIVLSVPHDKMLYELSKMHFLINIENTSNTQMPSKLIDYGMSKRPILSISQNNFSSEILNEFMAGNYEKQYHVDINKYSIDVVAKQFLDLYNSCDLK